MVPVPESVSNKGNTKFTTGFELSTNSGPIQQVFSARLYRQRPPQSEALPKQFRKLDIPKVPMNSSEASRQMKIIWLDRFPENLPEF